MNHTSNVFDLFTSKENIKIIKDSITSTIQNEYQQKIGNRYDDLIENKMNELMKKVDNKVPDGKTKSEYILMMNKKLISAFLLPTIRANAIKEKSRLQTQTQAQSQAQKRVYDDPQDLLKQNKVRDEQFNLPLEDISQRFIPDYPRPNQKTDLQLKRMENERNIYQSFSNGMPQNIPKFQDDLPEKRHDETLAMFNQLKAAYQEERIKNGDVNDDNNKKVEQIQPNIVSFEDPYHNNTFQKKKVILRKNKFETPIEEVIDDNNDNNNNNNNDNKIKELLTLPQTNIVQQSPFLYTEKKKNKISIHFSSNYRNFEYHKSSSSIRIYLTPYFDNQEDNFVYFSIPSYTDKHGNMIYNDFISKHNMDHHIQIPTLKNLESIHIKKIKLNQEISENKLKVEILPRIVDNNQNNKINYYYHNFSNDKCDLFLYDKNKDIYVNVANEANMSQNIHVDLQSVIKNNYIQINIYDIYGQKLFYEKDILHIHKIDVYNDNQNILLYYKCQNKIKSIINQLKEKNHKIYIYSLLPNENNSDYVELSDSVLLESVDIIGNIENKFKLCALYMIDEDNHYKVNFKELFEKCKKDLEDDTHKNISDLFYFVIKQQGKHGSILYYCNIDYIDELGNIILIHKEYKHIVENYENTEQFGFIKKNFNGSQSNDINSLFRPQGFYINDIEEKDDTIIFKIPIHNDSLDYTINIKSLQENEAFIRFDTYEIDLSLDLTFS